MLRPQQLIGLKTKIVSSSDPTLVGLSGDIVSETKNTIVLLAEGNLKTIPKSVVRVSLVLADKEVEVDGKELVGRPENL